MTDTRRSSVGSRRGSGTTTEDAPLANASVASRAWRQSRRERRAALRAELLSRNRGVAGRGTRVGRFAPQSVQNLAPATLSRATCGQPGAPPVASRRGVYAGGARRHVDGSRRHVPECPGATGRIRVRSGAMTSALNGERTAIADAALMPRTRLSCRGLDSRTWRSRFWRPRLRDRAWRERLHTMIGRSRSCSPPCERRSRSMRSGRAPRRPARTVRSSASTTRSTIRSAGSSTHRPRRTGRARPRHRGEKP